MKRFVFPPGVNAPFHTTIVHLRWLATRMALPERKTVLSLATEQRQLDTR